MTRSYSLLCGLCLLAFVFTGCGPNDGKVPVEGVVYLDDSPVEGASIAFVGNGGGSFGTASTDAEGKFSLRAAPGLNKITVNKADTSAIDGNATEELDADGNVIETEDGLMGSPEQAAEAEKNAADDLVASKFADPETSGIEITVEEGMEPVEIKVTSK